ncbi:MAG: YihY/virulence factor BrkB family protein, partial [Geminicoccales bacterium]
MRAVTETKRVLIDALKGSYEDNLLHWAAAVAFYAALSVAPLLFIALTVVSLFADAGWAADRLATILGNFLPDESEQQLRDFVSHAQESRGRVGLLSGVAFLYTGTRVFSALTRAILVIYEHEQEHQLVRQLVTQVVMLLTLGLVFLVALSSRFFFSVLGDAIGFLPSGEEQAAELLVGGLIQIVLLYFAFSLIFRFVPSRERQWRPAFIGAGVATLLFVIVRPLFVFYLERFS